MNSSALWGLIWPAKCTAETWDCLLMHFISDALPQVQDPVEDAD